MAASSLTLAIYTQGCLIWIGNVAQYAALKVIELGGIVMSLSDSKGAIVATTASGISAENVSSIAAIKVDRTQLSDVTSTSSFSSKVKIHRRRPPLVGCRED